MNAAIGQSTWRLLSYDELHGRGIRFSREQLQRLMRAGRFPKSIKLGGSRIAWDEGEIEAWLAARKAERAAA
jgi:prophage regulatory protein